MVVESIMLKVMADRWDEGASQIEVSEICERGHSTGKNDRWHLHNIKRVNFIVIGNAKRCIPVKDLLKKIIEIF